MLLVQYCSDDPIHCVLRLTVTGSMHLPAAGFPGLPDTRFAFHCARLQFNNTGYWFTVYLLPDRLPTATLAPSIPFGFCLLRLYYAISARVCLVLPLQRSPAHAPRIRPSSYGPRIPFAGLPLPRGPYSRTLPGSRTWLPLDSPALRST